MLWDGISETCRVVLVEMRDGVDGSATGTHFGEPENALNGAWSDRGSSRTADQPQCSCAHLVDVVRHTCR